MKKVMLFSAIAASMMAASCSNDSVLEHNTGEITFGVSATNGSRAQDVYCTNNLPGDFNVYAGFDNKIYINGDKIEKNGSSWINTAGVRYWPEGGDVTFYGIRNNGTAWSWDGKATTAPVVADYEVSTDVAEQLDLVYARKTQARQETTEATPQQVALNFRHALSQVVYRAKNINPNLYVEISGVEIVNIDSKGTYTLPTTDTDKTYVNHTEAEDVADETQTSRGTWASSLPATYGVTFDAVAVEGNNTLVALTSANATGKEYSENALLLIPNKKDAWDSKNEAAKTTTGTYFKLTASIWNVAGDKVNKATDICLWDQTKEGCESIYMPVPVDWKEGKKYIYTFVFGKGNGGHEPDPENPDPKPVLVPIDFTVTVDDFIPAGNTDIDMEVNDEEENAE